MHPASRLRHVAPVEGEHVLAVALRCVLVDFILREWTHFTGISFASCKQQSRVCWSAQTTATRKVYVVQLAPRGVQQKHSAIIAFFKVPYMYWYRCTYRGIHRHTDNSSSCDTDGGRGGERAKSYGRTVFNDEWHGTAVDDDVGELSCDAQRPLALVVITVLQQQTHWCWMQRMCRCNEATSPHTTSFTDLRS